MKDYSKKYFLAANSCEGFYSKFSENYDVDEGWYAYLIKGGPGTGKSSFMKYLTASAQKKDIPFELGVCSSDPNSLDAVIFPTKKIIVMDATPPHTVEPTFPAACEEILNFGEFWDSKKIAKKREEIINVTRQNKLLHKKASGFLKAAGELIFDNYKTALSCTDREKAKKFAETLCKKHLKNTKREGKEWIRFIEGISPLGIISYSKTITENYKDIIVISDNFGSASNIIMETLRKNALALGYEIITLKNPFLPSLITDHIIIPELSLAFVTENEYIHFTCESRRIHSRRFVNNTKLHNSLSKINFSKKISKELLLCCAEALNRAKKVHDTLEKYYIDAMDFGALTRFAQETTEKMFS